MVDDAVVARLHARLVRELRDRRHDPARPLQISDLYEDVVPYRAVRAVLDVELNADYEHALLRLLAGENGLLELESDEVRQVLSSELAQPDPSVSVFRRFGSSLVRVNLPPIPDDVAPSPFRSPAAAPVAQPEPELGPVLEPAAQPEPELELEPEPEPELELEAEPAAQPEPEPELQPEPRRADEPGTDFETEPEPWEPWTELPLIRPWPAATGSTGEGSGSLEYERRGGGEAPGSGSAVDPCPHCTQRLPSGREIRYCPFCGRDPAPRRCSRCQGRMEPNWRFCVECGQEVGVA
jgi:hypothetical protein